jgi:pimeloyl-ACP methyl ester carboxylesterase
MDKLEHSNRHPMKNIQLHTGLLSVYMLLAACSAGEPVKTTFTSPRSERCIADSQNTYQYILPENPKEKLPLVIALDPHGNGLLAVKIFREAVSYIPCVVASSNLVKNNYPNYPQAIQQMIDDACTKFPVDRHQIYLAGFSGGARMAFEYALKNQVKGVLMCGAGPSQNPSEQLPFRLYMIAGTTDFNFSELYYNPFHKKSEQEYFTDFFRGKHEWPSPSLLEDGLLYLSADVLSQGKALLKHKSTLLCNMADSLEQINEHFFALKSLEKAVLFDQENSAAQKQFKLLKEAGITNLKRLEENLALEGKIFSAYSEAAMQHDSIWWFNEINQLDLKIEKNGSEERDHYLRIRAFLGILFYSRLNMLINGEPGNLRIIHLLAAYRNLEPQNPDTEYFYALHSQSRKAARNN